MSRGSMGKMVRSEKEFELLWLLGWWVHPAAAAPTKKDFPLSSPPWIYPRGKNCARNWMNRVEVACEGERGSWRCHWCLREAVIGSTSYLLWAHTVITLTTQRIRLSVQTPPPLFLPCSPPHSDRWSKQPGADSLYYASMLLQQVTDRPRASSRYNSSEMSEVSRP